MKKGLKKLLCIFSVIAIMCALAVPCFAATEDASAVVSAISSSLGEITGVLTVSNIVTVLGIVLGIAVIFFFFWWGVRKVLRMARHAFAEGTIKV